VLAASYSGLGENTTPECLDRWAASTGRSQGAPAEKLCRRNEDNWGVFMKSTVVKRSIVVAGHKTSVSLEDAFWNGLKDIVRERHMTLSELVAEIDARRQFGNLSSALRLFVLEQMMAGRATLFEHTKALENEARAHSSAALCASSAGLK
jgi:predicted DNA-binding ribbon-helix-helix protein